MAPVQRVWTLQAMVQSMRGGAKDFVAPPTGGGVWWTHARDLTVAEFGRKAK